jgi:phytoene dehydrogenase-like protein
MTDVIVVGAGLAGLCCARELTAHGQDVLVLERGDDVGGRVRTDEHDGFLLDRGFQVLLTAYPEARRVLDYDALGLRPFLSGALVRRDGRFLPLADPLRRPTELLNTLRDGPGSLLDKLRVARLRLRLGRMSLNEILHAPQTTTAEALRREGFSPAFVEAFWRPFLRGVLLDPELSTSSREFAFVVKLFAGGEAALPAAGMQALPRQVAAGLPPGSVRTGVTVEAVEDGGVRLAGGERLTAGTVVVAAEGPEAARLTGAFAAPAPRAATCLYFAAERTPLGEPLLVLDGEGRGPVNNLAVLSDVAPSYAPPGAALISATVVGIPALDDAALERAVRDQLRDWFGAQVGDWRLLRTYRIPYALPALIPAEFAEPERPVRLAPGLLVCGDHRDTASIQGAMASGRRAAAAVRGLDVAPSCAPPNVA